MEDQDRIIRDVMRGKSVVPEEVIRLLLDNQERFLSERWMAEKDQLLSENERLNREIARLTRTVMTDNEYINYLLNSKWWKLGAPIRRVTRKIDELREGDTYNYVRAIEPSSKENKIRQKVSVIIFTYNAGNEFTVQLRNLTKQRYLSSLEIIVIDRGSTDRTCEFAREFGAKVIEAKDDLLTDTDLYIKFLQNINGEYVVMINQDKVIDSKYWIYQSILPIRDGDSSCALFFDEPIEKQMNQLIVYRELKKRISEIMGTYVLFLPVDRNIIHFISPMILDKTCALVKKKTIKMMLV